jgi:uncharacterized protein (DUF2147 family)
MKLRLIGALAAVLLTAGAAYAASDSDQAPAPTTPAKHDKDKDKAATPKSDKTKADKGAATPKADKDKSDKDAASAPKSDKDKPKFLTFDHKTAAGFFAQADDDGFVGAWFYFTQKNGVYEGRIVKAFMKPDADPKQFSNLCEKCEGDQKDAPMIGLTIIKGMKRDGLDYQNGSIMDPRDGSVYNAQMQLSEDGKQLSVRGYLGISLLGQTQVWNRMPDNSMAADDIPPESFGPSAKKKDSAKAQ